VQIQPPEKSHVLAAPPQALVRIAISRAPLCSVSLRRASSMSATDGTHTPGLSGAHNFGIPSVS
jgi:hypothetical protein